MSNSTISQQTSFKSQDMIDFLYTLQDNIVSEICKLEGIDVDKFVTDIWENEGHNGKLMVLEGGKIFDRAGITLSVVKDNLSEKRREQLAARGYDLPKGKLPYVATGLSLVFHPSNPYCPTVHLNYRYFEVDVEGDNKVWWFGGGTDLTPSYLFEEDAKHFHTIIKQSLDKFSLELYPTFKDTCDKYFYLPHRKEHRGIGGIFFDDLLNLDIKNKDKSKVDDPNRIFELVKSCANSFIPAYFPIVAKRLDTPYQQNHKDWQLNRRGRYVEFNLVYDRGTHFGLQVPGIRVENILISMPPLANWKFNVIPEKNSHEERTVQELKKTKDWVNWN